MTLSHIPHVEDPSVDNALSTLAKPEAWIRLRRFRENDMIVRDYAAIGTTIAARVRSQHGVITDIAIMPYQTLEDLYLDEIYSPGRPWNQAGASDNTKNLKPQEFVFGMSTHQPESEKCVLITPATYFERTGNLWPTLLNIQKLLPSQLEHKTPGTYQIKGEDFEAIKDLLIHAGFIEADPLSFYHQESIELEEIQRHEQGTFDL
jgi:hypothetical protein